MLSAAVVLLCSFVSLVCSCPASTTAGTNCATGVCPSGQSCFAPNSCTSSSQSCLTPNTCTASTQSCQTTVTYPVCSVATKGGNSVATIKYCVTSGTCADLGGTALSAPAATSTFDLCCAAANLGQPAGQITYEQYTVSSKSVTACIAANDATGYKVCTGGYCVRFPHSCEASDNIDTTAGDINGGVFGAATFARCCGALKPATATNTPVAGTAATTATPFTATVDKCTKGA